ncbi:hypothetical protein F5888DRAFT_1803834 [Russula emetica]|nr:hypothetical protein F5888DRAFT_1803834 [Russula emetica]
MPALHKTNGSTKHSTKVAATLKRKASKVVKALVPKKKRKGPTGSTVSLSDTSSNNSDEPSIIDGSSRTTVQTDMEEEEGADVELERLKKDWNAPIYSFFHPEPTIDYDKGRCFHVGLPQFGSEPKFEPELFRT